MGLFRVCLSSLFIMPVIVPFFFSRGLSQTDIGVLQAIFMTAAFIAEVPAGYIADRIGRKESMMAGMLMAALGFVVYAFAAGFWQLVLAETLIGVGISFVSGCETAYLYELLKVYKKEHEAARYDGNLAALGAVGAAVSGLCGAIMASTLGFTTTLLVDAGVMVLGATFAAMLPKEPEYLKKTIHTATHPLRDIARVVKYSLRDHQEVKWLILFSAVAGVSTHTAVWLLQPAYIRADIPLVWFGVIWAVINLFLAVISRSAGRTIKSLGEWNTAWLIILAMVLAYVILGISGDRLALLSISGLYWTRGLTLPLMQKLINERIESIYRATVMSVRALTHRALYIVMNPLVGYMVDRRSLGFAFIASGVIYGGLGLLALSRLLRFVFVRPEKISED